MLDSAFSSLTQLVYELVDKKASSWVPKYASPRAHLSSFRWLVDTALSTVETRVHEKVHFEISNLEPIAHVADWCAA